jgi:myosin heavy subunit
VTQQEGTRVAKLLGTEPEELYKNFLKPKIKVGNEFVTQGRNKDQVSVLGVYVKILSHENITRCIKYEIHT